MSFSVQDLLYLERCNSLANNALGNTYPNPLVGAVIVHRNKIIGEGYHVKSGLAHAEVNAIHDVKDKSLLPQSTLYVNLEPCIHFGKTPPCANKIVEHGIPRVFIDKVDPNPKVANKGIEFLRSKGTVVVTNDRNSLIQTEINKRFFTYHEKKRPYIILKWAQSNNGFIDGIQDKPIKITNIYSQQLSHLWRTQEQAILIGKNTYVKDNPQLNARLWTGISNNKIVIDKNLIFPKPNHLFQQSKVMVFNEKENLIEANVQYRKLDFNHNIIPQILENLYHLQIQSVIVEGGTHTLNSFIQNGIWDEARVFTNTSMSILKGIKAPVLENATLKQTEFIEKDKLEIYFHVTN